MQSEIKTRYAGVADAALLADLGRRTFVDAFGSQNDPAHIQEYVAVAFTVDRLEDELRDPLADFLIAEEGGEALGYAKIALGDAPACVTSPDPIELERIYVHQSAIGTGVGSALMSACLEAIETRGGRSAWLGVWERNERAIRFYRKWGFEIVGEKMFVLGGEQQTDVVMTRLEDLKT